MGSRDGFGRPSIESLGYDRWQGRAVRLSMVEGADARLAVGHRKKQRMIKNLPVAEVVRLAELVTYQPEQVVSRTLAQDSGMSLTLFAFPAGEGLTAHTTPADALAYVLDREAVVEIDGNSNVVGTGEAIVMPANQPHAVTAQRDFKMLLVVVR